ncbi:hypothetical protein CDL15_Pgr017283 [Punica granatum]|uniref:Uncharacterized protein n=1 Tax=Punica granatum TaxID=22663 RepID=A0A218WKI3_PUNGR|nr:hypothetical protein CDL15_Pgr017283 [Punica granatum]
MDIPRHTIDNCYILQGKLQEMIERKQLSFSEVKPLNVQTNPLPDHRSGSGPTINMIGICPLGKDEAKEEDQTSFVIDCTSLPGPPHIIKGTLDGPSLLKTTLSLLCHASTS